MANKKISELEAITTLDGTELLPTVQGGITKKVSISQIVDEVDSYTQSEADTLLGGKVDKVSGSSLVADTKVTLYDNHLVNTSNPHSVTKSQIGLSNVDNTSDVNKPVSSATQTALNTKANASEVYTKTEIDTLTLDYYTEAEINQFLEDYSTTSQTATLLQGKADLENGKVKLSQLPDSVLGQVEYKGLWNASTNTPDLTTVLPSGKYYITSVTGTFNSVVYEVGDWILSNGTSWDKVDNTDAVSSVNGYTGNVVLTKSDLSLGNVDNTSDLSKPLSTAAINALGNKADKATTLSGYGITDAISSTASQTAKYVLIAPNGANGAPTFRLLLASDIPTLNQNTTGSSGSCTGNSATATTLATARNINGVSFNGSADITVGVSGDNITWATASTAGKFDTSTTTPTSTNRLNYGGYIYPTYINLTGSDDTTTASSHYFVETGSDGFVRPKTLANVKAEIVPTYYTRGSGTAGITGATNYALFPSAADTLTLPIGVYKVSCDLYVSVATSTVSATLGFNFRGGGTAVGNIYGTARGTITNGGTPVQYSLGVALGTNAVVTAASAVAGRVHIVNIEAIVDVTTAGTIIPAYQWSATLTSGVVTLSALNNMVITKLADTSVATFGGWA